MQLEPVWRTSTVLLALRRSRVMLPEIQTTLSAIRPSLATATVCSTRPWVLRERELLRQGNAAAATVLGGALVALAIPLSALLATTGALLDILVWGVVALLLQLLTVAVVFQLLRGMRTMIEAGQVAGAIPLVAAQLAIALLNAAAMVPA
jgi:uncharacterized membrane protein YjfL (UPF0719 family)